MDDLGGYVSDDELAIEPLAELGYAVTMMSWRQKERVWSDFEAVIIRTPWDYQTRADDFLNVLHDIERASRLFNPLRIVKWNLRKTYLQELANNGCSVVPSIWPESYGPAEFCSWKDGLATDELIIKPVVSATAEHTYRLRVYDPELENVFTGRPFLVQPFLSSIIDEGEYSLFFFNGELSHAINKSPEHGDFRVQEEHGGVITAIEPLTEMIEGATPALRAVGETLLYARVDLARDDSGHLVIMELELIEPSLYLRMDPVAPRRFASAIDKVLN
jgi:glutathione synthase/RimK-type ligase-like ATP-grasp enzyme